MPPMYRHSLPSLRYTVILGYLGESSIRLGRSIPVPRRCLPPTDLKKRELAKYFTRKNKFVPMTLERL